MALRQHAKGFYDDLEKLSDQQLRSILTEELDSEDVDTELIKNITDVLAARANDKPIDAEAAFQQFLSQYADTDPLYSEVEFELGLEDATSSNSDKDTPNQLENPKKVIHFSRLAKLGILVAAILVLFLAGTIVAYAFGFRIWQADVSWDKDNMTVSSVGGETSNLTSDPYSQIREAISAEGIDYPVVPYYIPEGFAFQDMQTYETPQGEVFIVSFSNKDQLIVFNYTLNPTELNSFFPKDETEVELYSTHGIDYYITTNEGLYRAVWGNNEVVCKMHGVETKEELLKIIDSIH
ncbi:MAG: DUF4367 domain-containing protein [Oscillospiraceae bacterium]|nr:DUF4367 domain-containing protein [Oscillospiraceae bacterium]